MATAFQISGIPGLVRPIQLRDKAVDATVACMMGFDRLPDAVTDSDVVAISGAAAGSAAVITTGSSIARLSAQTSHLILSPHATGAFVQSHPFVPHRGMILHLYQTFAGEFPSENDYNFFEIQQNDNVIAALRMTTVGDKSRLMVVDALSESRQIGADDLILKNTIHFIQFFFENIESSNMRVWVDGVLVHSSGDMPSPDNPNKMNFRDAPGGNLTAFLKNDTAGPTLETNIHCAGFLIEHGTKVERIDLPTGILFHGARIVTDISDGEFDVIGQSPGPALASGTSLNMGDADTSTRATYAANIGGLWTVLDSTDGNPQFERMASAYFWVYDIDADATDGPATARMYFGGTQPPPSIPDIAFVEVPHGVVSKVHHQVIVPLNASPLPLVGISEDMVIGFENVGVSGGSQVVGVVEMYTMVAFFLPSPPESVLATAPSAGSRVVDENGLVMISKASGRLGLGLLYNTDRECSECCAPELIASILWNCFIGPSWDLTPYKGNGIGIPCSWWRLELINSLTLTSTTFARGAIDGNGKLLTFPDNVPCVGNHDSFFRLENGCGLTIGVAQWPD